MKLDDEDRTAPPELDAVDLDGCRMRHRRHGMRVRPQARQMVGGDPPQGLDRDSERKLFLLEPLQESADLSTVEGRCLLVRRLSNGRRRGRGRVGQPVTGTADPDSDDQAGSVR